MTDDRTTEPIEATYRDESDAAEALHALQASGIRARASRRELEDAAATHAAETKEGSDVAVGVAASPMTTYQLRSALGGTIAGGLVLGALGAIAGAILFATHTVATPVFVAIVVGAGVAGATIGGVLGGSRGGVEEIEHEEQHHTAAVRVMVTPRTPDEARRARAVLESHRPEWIGEFRRGA
jgi:hypothetical protein